MFETAKKAVENIYNVASNKGWENHGADSDGEFQGQGGSHTAHVYGEVMREGMFTALKEAVCLDAPDTCKTTKGLASRFQEFQFFDLGSGQGKFPMFASLLGFSRAKGIELDDHRSKYASECYTDFSKAYSCLAEKLDYTHGSFIDKNAAWTKETAKRVLFLDAVCFEAMWPDISRMMMEGKD